MGKTLENLTFDELDNINTNEFRDNQPMPKWIAESIRQEKESEDRYKNYIIGARRKTRMFM